MKGQTVVEVSGVWGGGQKVVAASGVWGGGQTLWQPFWGLGWWANEAQKFVTVAEIPEFLGTLLAALLCCMIPKN